MCTHESSALWLLLAGRKVTLVEISLPLLQPLSLNTLHLDSRTHHAGALISPIHTEKPQPLPGVLFYLPGSACTGLTAGLGLGTVTLPSPHLPPG